MNRSTIDWPFKPFYTWNPIVGCKKGCEYCYAERMNNRFKWIPDWTNPVFFRDRLIEPYQLIKPSTIFVGSMCDMFGDWICKDWIKEVLYICQHNPQHTFMFLTKNPKRYLEFDFPANVMPGCTITDDSARTIVMKVTMRRLKLKGLRTFVSIEPIHSGFNGISFYMFDLVIIGAETGRTPIVPLREWVYSIVHPNIYYKKSIIKHFPELKNSINELQRTSSN